MDIRANGQYVAALIDSGASASCVRAGEIKGTTTPLQKRSRLKLAVSSCSGEITSVQSIECVIDTVRVVKDFLVVPNLNDTIILGHDFLTLQKAIIDFQRRAVHLGANRRTTAFWKRNQSSTTTQHAPLTLDKVRHDFDPMPQPEFEKLLTEFADTFNGDAGPSTTPTVKLDIKIKDELPFRVGPYRYSDEKKRIIY